MKFRENQAVPVRSNCFTGRGLSNDVLSVQTGSDIGWIERFAGTTFKFHTFAKLEQSETGSSPPCSCRFKSGLVGCRLRSNHSCAVLLNIRENPWHMSLWSSISPAIWWTKVQKSLGSYLEKGLSNELSCQKIHPHEVWLLQVTERVIVRGCKDSSAQLSSVQFSSIMSRYS